MKAQVRTVVVAASVLCYLLGCDNSNRFENYERAVQIALKERNVCSTAEECKDKGLLAFERNDGLVVRLYAISSDTTFREALRIAVETRLKSLRANSLLPLKVQVFAYFSKRGESELLAWSFSQK